MKVLLHYEDNEDSSLHKSLKITLPKSWKTGPTSRLLTQFLESYNANESFQSNPLTEATMHLETRSISTESGPTVSGRVALASDAVVVDVIADRADIYIVHGPSRTLQDMADEVAEAKRQKAERLKGSVACLHFGCQNRFPKGGPYPDCRYHKAPPVFHETAKFWSCCPNKKAYDWETFQAIPGCETGTCTDVREEGDDGKQFLGGSDLREKTEAVPLKSIDDFNKAQTSGEAAPILERLETVLLQLGVEKELFQQVVHGMKVNLEAQTANEAELMEAVKNELGGKLKAAIKAVAVEQLRIK